MDRKNPKRLIFRLACVLMALSPLSAWSQQGQTDSLVRILNGQSIQLIERHGMTLRKAIKATFQHNGTLLISDTALWNVNAKTINCKGNVQLIQGETLLTSETLDYFIDRDLAEFRGGVVQLRNKKENILRTRHLDYNTKDSVALFRGGAAMRSEDGQIIESDEGSYSNVSQYFDFLGNVNMFTDSVRVCTSSLRFDSDANKAYFTSDIDFFKDGRMLSASRGWYEKNRETFLFRGKVHGLSEDQESWSDSLFYYRTPNNILMLGNVHVQDSSRSVAALSDYLFYEDSLSKVTLKKDAAIAMWQEQDGVVDTTYVGADTWIYQTFKKNTIPREELLLAASRLEEISIDAVAQFRAEAARKAAEAAEAAKDANPNIPKGGSAKRLSAAGNQNSGQQTSSSSSQKASSPKTGTPKSSLSAPKDSLQAVRDSIALSRDTTKIGFATGLGNIRIFKTDMQLRCDSLRYSDLDSIVRLYKSPVVWNETNRQYTSDSLFVLIKDNKMDRASLNSNAFITVREDSLCFDQIKSSDAMAYFDGEMQLRRFDALGDATALFYLEENDVLATVNKVESRMLSATFADGELESIFYFEKPKNDAYPLVQLPAESRLLKGFNWQGDRRPQSKDDITRLRVKPSQRSEYMRRRRPAFRHTNYYFPQWEQEYAELKASRAKKAQEAKAARAQSPLQTPSEERLAPRDSLRSGLDLFRSDSLAIRDSLGIGRALRDSISFRDSLGLRDSLALKDSLAAADSSLRSTGADSLGFKPQSPSELRRALRIARRDARWSELDERDRQRAAAKAEAKARRLAKRNARLAKRQAIQDEKDRKKLEKYIQYYEKRKANNESEPKPEPAGERPEGTPAGRNLQTVDESRVEASGGDAVLGVNGTSDDSHLLGGSRLPRP